MKPLFWVGVLAVMMAEPAIAQTQIAPHQEPDRIMGSSENAPKWTLADVKAMCEARWPGQDNSIMDCITRNKRKIGHDESPADIQELDLTKKPSTSK